MGQQIEELRGVAKLDIREFLSNANRIVQSARDMATGARNAMVDFATSFSKGSSGASGAATEVEQATDKMADATERDARRIDEATDGIARDFHNVRDAAGRFARSTPAFEGMRGSLLGLRENLASVGREMVAIGTRAALVFGGMATAATAATSVVGFQFLSQRENTLATFETLLGSAQAAKKMFGDLSKFAAETPFEMPGLLQATQMLMAARFEASSILPMLRTIGDATAGLGGDPEVMQGIIRALGQIRSKGKATAEDLAQLAERGIPVWSFLATKLGVDIPRAMEMVSDGAVDAETAISAMLVGMQTTYSGLTQKLAGSFSGMLSTMRDNARAAAAYIVEPMFLALKNIMADLSKGGGFQEVNRVMDQVRAKVQDAAVALRAYVSEHRAELVRNFAQAISWTVNSVSELAQWLREVGPPLVSFALGIGKVVGAVAQLVSQIPYVREFFAIFVVGHITGAKALLVSLFGVISQLVTVVTSLTLSAGSLSGALGTTLAGAARAATTAFGAMALGAASLAAVGVAVWISSVTAELAVMNEELKRSLDMLMRMQNKAVVDREKRLNDAEKKGGSAALEKQLAFEEADLQRRVDGAIRSHEDALKARQTAEGRGVFNVFTGANLKQLKEVEATRKAQLDSEQAELEKVRARRQELMEKASKGGSPSVPLPYDAPFGGSPSAAVASPPPAAVSAAGESVQALTNSIHGLDDAATQAAKATEDAAARKLPTSDMAHELAGLRGTIPAGSQTMLENAFVGLQQGTASGAIPHAEWQRGMGMLNTGSTAAQGFSQSLSQAQAGLPAGVSLDPEKVAAFNAQFDALLTSFMSGAMGAERFNAETRKLSDSMRQAAADAEKEAMAKQRQQMLAPFQGLLAQAQAQGANPMMQRALEDRLIQMQQQRLSQQIDGAVNGFLRMNGVIGQTTESFQTAAGQVDKFSQGMQRQVASPEQQSQWWGGVVSFLNSSAGAIASMQQQIQFAWSRFKVVRGKDDRLASQILEQINSLTNQLNAMMQPQTPMFSEVNGANVAIDPGLQTRSNGGTSVSMEFPNLTRLSNTDVQRVATALEYELRRKGRKV